MLSHWFKLLSNMKFIENILYCNDFTKRDFYMLLAIIYIFPQILLFVWNFTRFSDFSFFETVYLCQHEISLT